MSVERERLNEDPGGSSPWRRWGPYVSERAWGTVREDYSADGDAWAFFPHDHARSRAYRWRFYLDSTPTHSWKDDPEFELLDTGVFNIGPFDRSKLPVDGVLEQSDDPAWQGLIPFHEYFHGDTGAGLGASHQTGWTGLVANLIISRGRT